MSYAEFLARKAQHGADCGFDPEWMPDFLHPFQRALTEWAIRKGRGAVFADCGLGKTPMQLVWAENVVRRTNRAVLILTPLAVASQTLAEAEKFGVEAHRSTGSIPRAGIYVANYERLHHFAPADFGGVVCDESSILKHFAGATQKAVTRFMLKVPYRLLCTATAAPNDYIELGTSSEALGELGYSDMLSRFFRQDDKKPHRMEDVKQWRRAQEANRALIERADNAGRNSGKHFARLAYRVSQTIGQWRLKGHAVTPFWRWVASWARACRKPSDLGFEDGAFALPSLIEREHIIEPLRPAAGMLFTLPAIGLKEEREERRRTLDERCGLVATLVQGHDASAIWCHMNAEGILLEKLVPYSIEVAGRHDEEYKEAAAEWFVGKRCVCGDERFRIGRGGGTCGHDGGPRRLISKARVFGFGLNFQHCAHVATFASHSYEQFYQSVRRCWRFGQQRPVTVDVIATTGERHVRENMVRKAEAAGVMFDELVAHMADAERIGTVREAGNGIEVPEWA